jgi:DNA-binding response OmpR family regulator
MRILIVEDNPDIAANIGDFLSSKQHAVDFAGDGLTGLHLATTQPFDLILLDLMLPGIDGLEFARKLREEARMNTPILMLTARDTLNDRLAGFAAGGDDYLVKPFSLLELEARIIALHRRSGGLPINAVLQVGDLRFDLDTQVLTRGSRRIELKPMARKLLAVLMQAHGRVVRREELEHALWGDDPPDGDALRVHIHAIRHAVDQDEELPLVHTLRGLGYRLTDEI